MKSKNLKENLSVIDLFAGCGGLSTGFEMAGFEVLTAIEKDEWASETYKKNHPQTKVITKDITTIKDYNHEFAIPNGKKINGIIGGPPCQGFSLSGARDPKDPRNSLFMDFVKVTAHFNPDFIVLENVVGILSMKTKNGDLVQDVIIHEFENIGYTVKPFVLNAAEYGVPQSRMRVFFIGLNSKYEYNNSICPTPFLFGKDQITIEQAIMDLPKIKACEGTDIQKYTKRPANNYQKQMRKNSKYVYNHVAMRHTSRLVERFKQIGYGQSVADVSKEHMQRKRGNASTISSKVYSQNNMRPFPDKPSPTIPASFQSNFIHPFENRNYTAREGARIQSFPDDYIFCGKRTTMSWEKNLSQYQQIGNAVPPLLSFALAKSVMTYFEKEI